MKMLHFHIYSSTRHKKHPSLNKFQTTVMLKIFWWILSLSLLACCTDDSCGNLWLLSPIIKFIFLPTYTVIISQLKVGMHVHVKRF